MFKYYNKENNTSYKKNKLITFILYIFTVCIILVICQFCEGVSFFKAQDFSQYMDCVSIFFNILSELLITQSVSCSTEELSLNKKPLNDFTSEENKKIFIGVVAGLLSVGLIVAVYNNPELPAQC